MARRDARQAHFAGDLLVQNGHVHAGVVLAGAHIAGVLMLNHTGCIWLRTGSPCTPRGWTDHSIDCADFLADGGIYLVGATIGGAVQMLDARVSNPGGKTLKINRSIDNDLKVLGDCRIKGCLRLVQTHVHRQVNLFGAQLVNPQGLTMVADNLTVDQNLYCAGLRTQTETRLLRAHIAGDFLLTSVCLHNPGGHALDGSSLIVQRGVMCNEEFLAHGDLRLLGARLERWTYSSPRPRPASKIPIYSTHR